MEVVGVELLAMGMYFGNCGSLCDPFPGILVYVGIYVELGQKGLDITLVLGGHKSSLEVLSEAQLIVDVSLTLWLSASSTD